MVCARPPLREWRMVGGMSLSRCAACGFAWFPRSLYDGRSIEAQYVDDETSQTESYRMMEPFDLQTFAIRMRRIVTLTGSATGRVLDIGCNVGTFLEAEAAAQAGWKAVGVEPNPRAAEIAKRRGFEVHCRFFDGSLAPSLSRFDAVHAGDVIEHVFAPIEFLASSGVCCGPAALS